MAQLQKQKKKAGKKASTSEIPKEAVGDSSSKEAASEDASRERAPAEESTPAVEDAKLGDPEAESGEPESPVEPMPEAPRDLPTEIAPEGATRPDISRGVHANQPSLSVQSKLRSSSFRRSSTSQNATSPPSAIGKVSSLPPLTADGESAHEVFRKHTTRIEELEKDNKRLEREVEEANALCRRTEDQLQELREANVDTTEVKEKLEKAEAKVADIEALVSGSNRD